MNIEEANEIVKRGVIPGDIDSLDLSRAKGFLEGVASRDALIREQQASIKELVEALSAIDGLCVQDVEHNSDWGRMKLIAKDTLTRYKKAIKPTENKE